MEYGEITPILSACILQLEPIFLLTKQQIEYSELNKLSKIFYESASNTVKGSHAEHKLSSFPFGKLIDEHKIIETSRLLTSSLLIGAITSGGIIGGGTNHQIDELSNFAANFGIAYQLSDHIVDLMVNNRQTGKDNFSDIKNNQINLVVNYSLQMLPFDSSA
ncbi:MAG: hypothetical protein F6K22_28125 [Okeania sp. SIO2F4]|uniref:polyprenyl synthetase family protein n=1 Tax=Okeania sp. SIO2F4 TaxID=2607790 RepID=UPI001429A478|nr:polyprenyl synthetase family protein [Okeania sp. SIO2F4]NES06345.1 hypothetical protein [Okeania sp. SIO2F4]